MKHNFSAGPCILPREVIERAASAVLDFNESGLFFFFFQAEDGIRDSPE